MFQNEFEKSRNANLKALSVFDNKPDMKAIDLIDLLLGQDPSLPVVIQVGAQIYPIETVGVDNNKKVRIITSEANGLTNIL
ncbi:MAG: hypothetical protein JRE28_13635 [Deltaproteobacteria bacterium]|nr:hypothetical protein [Deltaproteobacteria bacterium]